MATGRVRTAGFASGPDGSDVGFFAVNKRGELIVMDFWTQLFMEGRMFHMQIGTESTPANSTTTFNDEVVWMLLDTSAGTTTLPAYCEVHMDTLTTGTAAEAMLEIDRAKNRYSAGGTAFVPENLRTDRPRASTCTKCYVGTDIAAAVKTAVPGSMEIARHVFTEDAIATATGIEVGNPFIFNAKERPGVAVVDIGSVLVHFGATTADVTGYGLLQWAEIPTTSVI